MRRHPLSSRLVALGFVATATLAIAACTSLLGDFEVSSAVGNDGGGGGKALGETCGAATECGSGFCADGVCCDTACNGSCEACNLAQKGTCSAVPDNQDPDKECLGTPLPESDGGVIVEGDAGAEDAGRVYEVDGGITTNDVQCAGTCNGNRACKFPAKEKGCGTQFCRSDVESTGARCDGAGHCTLQDTVCQGFGCGADGTCNVTCVGDEDCGPTHFCKDNVCKQKLSNGQECGLPTHCASGFCVGVQAGVGVCCDADCDSIAGGNCKTTGKVGSCVCGLPCANGCRLFYADTDLDNYGDPSPAQAEPGCVGDLPPLGFVNDNTDCNDRDKNVHPAQTQYFDGGAAFSGSFDFDCDGKIEKETPEFRGSACAFCEPPPAGIKKCTGDTSKSCFYAGQPATLDCKLTQRFPCAGGACFVCDGQTTPRSGTPLDRGFTNTIECGTAGTLTDCGGCDATGDPETGRTTTPGHVQRCR